MMQNPGTTTGSADTATGALSVNGPQPVWMTLNEARSRSFTGEIIFEDNPEVRAYLDAGVVYFAERVTDSPLGRRLMEAGVVDAEQLERGTVRVGDVEHLGRLFDREPTIDRDAVMVVTETSTEALITDLANRAITTVRATAYRHHPSGVHRWFVVQLATDAAARSARPFEANLIEELPGFNLLVDDELLIEWDDFDELAASTSPVDSDMFVFDSATAETTFVPVDVPVDEPTPEATVATAEAEAVEEAIHESDVDVVEFDYDAHDAEDVHELEDAHEVEDVWADDQVIETDEIIETEEIEGAELGSEGDLDVVDLDIVEVDADDSADVDVDEPEATDAEAADIVDDTDFELVVDEQADQDDDEVAFQVTWPDGTEIAVDESTSVTTELPVTPEPESVVSTDDDGVHFQMPELDLSDEDESATEVPDDVADAVRRAIAAIESVSVDTEVQPGGAPSSHGSAFEAAPPAPRSFAPPTPDMRAEVIYGAEAAAQSEAVDDGNSDDRSSALRRLIGSLRRKDH